MRSIRIFLITTLLATITLVNFISALHGYRSSLQEEVKLFKTLLVQKTELIKALVLENRPPDMKENYQFISGIFNKGEASTFAFQIWGKKNQLIVRSSNAPDKALLPFENQSSEINFNGHRWAALASFDHANQAWIIVAERSDVHFQRAEKIILKSVIPIILVIPFIGGMVWLIVSFGLRPISKLASDLEKKEAADLSPIAMTHIPKELTLLATTANDLLRRMEASFSREKRFTGDAAHELRTPIAALKIHLQNLLADIGSQPESARKLKLGVDRMGHLVEQILSLNRTAADHFMAKFTRFDLSLIVKKVIGDQIVAINKKKQSISFEGDPCGVYGDAFMIEVLIKNLLSNAIKYSPPGGEITVKTEVEAKTVVLQMVDNGPGIPEDKYDRVFERFYRVGGQKLDGYVIGCGLGLSIVKHIVDHHDASIKLSKPEQHSGLKIRVVFPTSFADGPSPL